MRSWEEKYSDPTLPLLPRIGRAYQEARGKGPTDAIHVVSLPEHRAGKSAQNTMEEIQQVFTVMRFVALPRMLNQ